MRTRMFLTLLLVAAATWALAPACSDDDKPTPDADVTADSQADQAAGDQATGDQATGDQATGDVTTGDQAATDQAAGDQTTGDQTTGDQATKQDAKIQPDFGAKCVNLFCGVANNCCDCKAYKTTSGPPACSVTTCTQPVCSELGILTPKAYCLEGNCLVSDVGTKCTAHTQCVLTDNCCDCLVLPKGAKAPTCKTTSCTTKACTTQGLSAYKARCVSGVCILGK